MIGARATRRVLVTVAALAATACGMAGKAEPTHPDGPVIDDADIIAPAEEAKLDSDLRAFYRTTGDALVVYTVTSLAGESIEKVAYDTFSHWGIGDADTNRGLLIVVAPNEREVRIEVGCGLIGVISDSSAKTIIEEDMMPGYKAGNLQAGTLAGVGALMALSKARAAPAANDAQGARCEKAAA